MAAQTSFDLPRLRREELQRSNESLRKQLTLALKENKELKQRILELEKRNEPRTA